MKDVRQQKATKCNMYFYFKIDLLFIFANKITRVMSYIYKIRTSVCMTISLVMMLFVTSCSNDDFFDLDDHYISDDYYMSELKALRLFKILIFQL